MAKKKGSKKHVDSSKSEHTLKIEHVHHTVAPKTHKVKPNKKTSIKKFSSDRSSRNDVDKLMIENFIALQRVLANLTLKFDSLTDQIEKLLALFESSAKSLAEKEGTRITPQDQEFVNKLDQLMEQNKLIAKGLGMMGERTITRTQPIQNTPVQSPIRQMPQKKMSQYNAPAGYQPSIASQDSENP